MKLVLTVTFALLTFCGTLFAQQAIQLNDPDMSRGSSLMQSLQQRKSVRSYSEKPLSTQDLSDLLWAAYGVNRPDEKKRTIPTASNVQDIDLYLFTAEGIYLYDASENMLNPVLEGDFRAEAGIQDFVGTAPVTIVIVSDLSRYRRGDEAARRRYAAMHTGSVSQNISLFCAANNMGTVAIGMLDYDAVKERLGLSETQIVKLSHPVGFLE